MSDNTQSADTQSKHTLLDEVRNFFKSLEGVAEDVVQKVEDFIEGKKAEVAAADTSTATATDATADVAAADTAAAPTADAAAPVATDSSAPQAADPATTAQ